jgi:hypothetical protein
MTSMDSDGPRWSEDVRQADWIAERLTPWGRGSLTVTAVVPAGFESYARLLHPAYQHTAAEQAASGDDTGDRVVRWAEVAAWSGRALHRQAQFHSVALPPSARPVPPPFTAGPWEGSLDLVDARLLAGIVRAWTATPDDCWFCVWDGFGWNTASSLVSAAAAVGKPPETAVTGPRADPVPAPVRDGQRVRLPHRDYLLYRGPAEAVTAPARLSPGGSQTANLWWPADRAWCVATEIDLRYTYVAGPAALIEALGGDDRIEALPALPDDPASLVLEDWAADWVDDLTDALLGDGEATLTTAVGTVRARLRRPTGLSAGRLQVETVTSDGSRSSSDGRPRPSDEAGLRSDVALRLTYALLALAQG